MKAETIFLLNAYVFIVKWICITFDTMTKCDNNKQLFLNRIKSNKYFQANSGIFHGKNILILYCETDFKQFLKYN